MTAVRLFLVAASVMVGAAAFAEPTFEVQRVQNREKTPFPVSQSNIWKWYLNSEKVKTLWVSAKLSSEEFSKFNSVKAFSQETRASLKGQELVFLSIRLTDGLLLSGSSPEKMGLRVTYTAPMSTVYEDNCRKERLTLKSAAEFPFYVGVSCKLKDGNLGISLTFPRDVDLADSTLFESKGKGESWRYYDLGKVLLTGQSLGQFKFAYKGKTYDFTLGSVAKEADAAAIVKENRITLSGGLGYGFFGLSSASGSSSSDSKPALVLRVPHYPIWKGLGLAMNIDLALPLTASTDSITYTQFEGIVGWEFTLGSNLRLRPKVEYVFSSTNQDSTNIALTINQLGFGAAIEYRLSDTYFITLDGMTAGLGGGALTGHLALDLSVVYKKLDSLGYGAGFRYQSYSAVGSLGIERTFSQNIVYLLLAF